MKRLLVVLLSLLMLFALSCAEAEPMLFQVTNGNRTLYLLPTIHYGTEEMAQALDARVLPVVQGADRLAVEIDDQALNDPLGAMRYASLLRYGGGEIVQAHLQKETYQAAVALLKRAGQYSILMDGYRAPVWQSLCETAVCTLAGLKADCGVDQVVMRFARKNGVPIEGMETPEKQYAAMLNASDALADQLIREITDDPQAAVALYQSLPALFVQGDEQALLDAAGIDLTRMPDALKEEAARYYEGLLNGRNDAFEQCARAYLEEDKITVFMVGALHILGEDGLAKRLSDAGYEVKLLK